MTIEVKRKLAILAMAYFLSLALFGAVLVISGNAVNAGGATTNDDTSRTMITVAWAGIGLATVVFGSVAAWLIIKNKKAGRGEPAQTET